MVKMEHQGFGREQAENSDKVGLDDDRTFFVDNYGGLNKTAPANNLPYADSPNMRNIKVSLAGMLSKRPGSFIRADVSTDPRGTFCTTYTLDTDEVLMIFKVGTSLSAYLLPKETENQAATLVNTFTDVWASAAETDRPSFVWTSEEYARLIMVSPNSVPVELEVVQLTMTGDGDSTIALIGDYSDILSSDLSWGIYSNTVVEVNSVSHASGTTTFTFDSNIPDGQIISLVGLNWHWWAEAIKRNADQVYGTNFRFNTSVTADANVEIPLELRRGLEADSQIFRDELEYGQKMMKCFQQNDNTGTAFTFDITPANSTEFAFSNQVYTNGAGESITPGTSYITFGGIAGTGTNPPTPVHMVRQTFLPFNGGTGITANELDVIDSTGFALTGNFSTTIQPNSTFGKYYYVLKGDLTLSTSSTDTVKAIRFNGGHPFGISESFVEVINSEPNSTFIGASASSTYYSPIVEGSYRPWYGASLYANYLSGVFPSVVGLYQDRLVLSGFLSAPLTVLCSNSKDNGSRYFYQNFQVDYEDTTIATNPVEVVLDGLTDDIITNAVSWFDSLFVFTRKSTRRVHGGENLAITPTANFQNTVSSIGCYSNHGVTRTDRNLVFISNSGLYSIEVSESAGNYVATNVGLKVEDFFFDNAVNPKLSWVFYNQLDDEIWMGLSCRDDEYFPTRTLVYFNKRAAWSEYSLASGLMTTVDGCTDSFRSFVTVVVRDTEYNEEPTGSSYALFCEFGLESVLTDLTYKETSANLEAGSLTRIFHTRVEFTVNSVQTIHSLSPKDVPVNYSNHAFRLLPVNDVSDNLLVRYNDSIEWSEKELNTDFTLKTASNSLRYISFPSITGNLLEVTLLNDNGVMPVHIIRDKYELPTDDYTVSEDGEFIKVTLIGSGDASAEYLVGQTIVSYHITPSFMRKASPRLKRVTHYMGYYSNKDFLEIHDSDSSGSELIDHFKIPVGLKLGVLYNDARTGDYDSEVYGTDELTWDISTFDSLSDAFRNQESDIVRLTVPVIGVGYSFQVINYNLSIERFQLIGYHILTQMKNRRSLYAY